MIPLAYPLTTSASFRIEAIVPISDWHGGFAVTLLLGSERRKVDVESKDLLNFLAFRLATLRNAHVLLRHVAEDNSGRGRKQWLNEIEMAIDSGRTSPGTTFDARGSEL